MSDVLIRDFKMPKSCGSCPFVAFYSRPEDRRCTLRLVEDPELSRLAGQTVLKWVEVSRDGVDKGCPLVEVKEAEVGDLYKVKKAYVTGKHIWLEVKHGRAD